MNELLDEWYINKFKVKSTIIDNAHKLLKIRLEYKNREHNNNNTILIIQ